MGNHTLQVRSAELLETVTAVAQEPTTLMIVSGNNQTGNGSFNYTVSDGNGGTDVVTVTVQLFSAPGSCPP